MIGHFPYCVVSVVGILIRSTLGWDDPDTGERRIEAELPLSAFLRPEISKSSARRGLTEGMAAGLLVRTASANSREGARYALRWADGAAQARAIERARRSLDDPLLQQPERDLSRKVAAESAQTEDTEMGEGGSEGEEGRGVKLTPLDLADRGVKLTPPRGVNLTPPNNKINKEKKNKKTLNVSPELNFVDLPEVGTNLLPSSGLEGQPERFPAQSGSAGGTAPTPILAAANGSGAAGQGASAALLRGTASAKSSARGPAAGSAVGSAATEPAGDSTSPKRLRSALSEQLDIQAEALAAELKDQGSARRHRQLLDICEKHGLSALPVMALKAVRRRQEASATGAPLDKPGAYYQRILIGLLEEHQVFVPKAGEDDVEEVRRLAREKFSRRVSRCCVEIYPIRRIG